MPGDLDFGPVLGSIWGPCWDHFGVKNRVESDWKKHQKIIEKKSRATPPGPARNLACGPLKETSQTGDWPLATGNWQDWGEADLSRPRNTPLRALRGARWRIWSGKVR